MKQKRGIRLVFCEKIFKDAFKQAYLWGRFFFFLISARQGVTITEICESGCKFWRKHLSTCRQVKLELNAWCGCLWHHHPCSLPYNTYRSQNKSEIWERKGKRNVNMLLFSFFYSFLMHLRKLVGKISSPVHTCRGLGSSLLMDFLKTNVFSFTLSFSFSHTLLSQRCCAVSHAGKVPFPSISGRLQRSIIREINGTGPISCLVPFESAKLLRTSKKMRQFIWGLASLLCKRQTHKHTHTQTIRPPPPPSYFEYSHNSNVHTHEHISKYSKLEQL